MCQDDRQRRRHQQLCNDNMVEAQVKQFSHARESIVWKMPGNWIHVNDTWWTSSFFEFLFAHVCHLELIASKVVKHVVKCCLQCDPDSIDLVQWTIPVCLLHHLNQSHLVPWGCAAAH